jgi:hypothetical protein
MRSLAVIGPLTVPKITQMCPTSPPAHATVIRFHPLPEMMPCILFDAANNLRSVLDQIGYAAAVVARSPGLSLSARRWRG